MTLDLSLYRTMNKPLVEAFCLDLSPAERLEYVGIIATATHCPILAICHYLGELHGYSAELRDKIERLKAFYHIEHIIN